MFHPLTRFDMGVLKGPHIGTQVGTLAFERSIPFLRPVAGFKHQLPVPVVYPEQQIGSLIRVQRVQVIVQPIAVGRKGIGYSDITAVGNDDLLYGCVETTQVILHDQAWIYIHCIGARQVGLIGRRLLVAGISIGKIPRPGNDRANALVAEDGLVGRTNKTIRLKVGLQFIIEQNGYDGAGIAAYAVRNDELGMLQTKTAVDD